MAIASQQAIQNYFAWPQRMKTLLKFVGVCALVTLIGLGGATPLLIAGCLGLAFCGVLFKVWNIDSASDGDIDDTFAPKFEKLENAALQSLNLELSDLTRPIDRVWGPYFSNMHDQRDEQKMYPYHWRVGKDGRTRGNARLFLLLLYGRDQVMTFKLAYNIEYGCETFPETTEYFYQDVVSVDSDQLSFTLTKSGGTKVQVPLSDQRGGEKGDRELANGTMNSVRTMLREKKATISAQ